MSISLQQKKSDLEALLADRKKELVKRLKDLATIQVSVHQLQAHVTSIESLITVLEAEMDAHAASAQFRQNSRRNPMDMLRDEYKGMKLGDIAVSVLEESQSPLTTTELSQIIYDTYNDNELSRARNSLSAELRAGIKGEKPRWQKLGRNAYASLDYSKEEAA